MNYKLIGHVNSIILFVEALFMVPAVVVSLIYREKSVALVFCICIGIICAVAGCLMAFCKGYTRRFYAKEGLVCVGLGWIVLSLFGCLPFVITKEIPNYIDALFEIVSGFTTTGASICTNVEALSHGILYWRSFSHWLGGMGVLVFILAIVPFTGKDSGFTLHILKAESPGPEVGKTRPKMKSTARISYVIYIVLTVLDVIFLLIGGCKLFDSICIAFGTAGTGGFGVLNSSIGSYSPFAQNVCTVFMMLFGVNFTNYYYLVNRDIKTVAKDEELRFYIGTFLAATILVILNIHYTGTDLTTGELIRHSAFTTASIMTTTGFGTVDFNLWPSFSKAILLFLMFCGASAGSTGGGIKCSRVLLIFKSLRRNVKHYLHPNRVQSIKLNGKAVDEDVISNTNIYLCAYVIIVIISMLLVSWDGFSVETNFSAVMATFNNIGPGFGSVGPTANYAGYTFFSKIVFIMDMLAGRLEIFPILVPFSKTTWKR